MVASHAVMNEAAETIVKEMAEHMETIAAAGDWEEVERIAVRLQSAVMTVPEARRREMLVVAQQATERVTDLAREARGEVTGRMSAIRRGQAATKAYELR